MAQDAPPARELWTWLGFSYAAIDIDGSPGSIPLDLNFASAPTELVGKHHLVTNFGTTEHIANQLNAFKIVHDLTAPGGVMMHTLPAQGAFNHGLINYNPKFFWALARANDYRWLYFDFISDAVPHPMPDNLVEAVRPFRAEIEQTAAAYRVEECSLWVALQKRNRAPFAVPSDAPPAAAADEKSMAWLALPGARDRRFGSIHARRDQCAGWVGWLSETAEQSIFGVNAHIRLTE